MSKSLLILLAAVLIVALLVPAMPVRAQDGGEFPVPAACTAEEQLQLTDVALDLTGRFAEAASSVVPETANDYAALALAMNEVRRYFNGDEVNMPFCTDMFVFGSSMEFWIDNYILQMQQSALYFYATEAGDTELANKMMEYGTFHIEKTTYYQEQLGQVVEVLGEKTPILPEWFPVCTADDFANQVYTQLLALEDSTDEQAEALTTFTTDGTMRRELLYFMEDLIVAWEPLTDDMPLCSDIFWRELLSGVISYETSIALHWGAMAEYAEGDLNTTLVAARDDAAEVIVADLEDWHAMFDPEAVAE